MTNESDLQHVKRIADRLVQAGMVVVTLSLVAVVVAAFFSIAPHIEASGGASRTEFSSASLSKEDVDSFLVKVAGRQLIRPPQIQSAVKDTGAAARLVKKMNLQGIVRIGNDLVAYIQVGKQGVRTVRQGETVMDFVVKSIETDPGRVTLSLEGVEVVLAH